MNQFVVSHFISGDYEVAVVNDDVAAVAACHPCDSTHVPCTRIHLRGGQTLYVYATPEQVRKAIGWTGPRSEVA